jgi:hypothetical protein
LTVILEGTKDGSSPRLAEEDSIFQKRRWYRLGDRRKSLSAIEALKLQVTDIDLSYIAGYLDGEGHIAILKVSVDAPSSKKAGLKSPQYLLRVEIANTTIQSLEWIQRLFGGYVVRANAKKRSPRSKRCWRWLCCGWTAYRFLGAITPFLRQKQPQAVLALAFWEARTHDRILVTHHGRYGGSLPLSVVEVAAREDFYQRMRKLNKRGTSV